MGFNAMEIGGLVVIAVAAIMQISAVATLRWQTYEMTLFGIKISADYGLFKVCTNSPSSTTCLPTTNAKGQEAAYRGAQATAVISLLSMFGFIGATILLKIVLKKRTLIPIIILGVSMVMFNMITVIVYADKLRLKGFATKLGASFYVACVAIVLDVVGVVIHVIGERSAP